MMNEPAKNNISSSDDITSPTVLLGNLMVEKGYIRGPFGSALRRPEMQSSGIPVYEQQNAIYNHRKFRFYINEAKYQVLKRFTVKSGDLVISCSGTLGKVTVIQRDDPIGIISQALLILRPDTRKVSSDFLYYYLTSPIGQSSLLGASHGSVQTNIAKREVVSAIKIPKVSLDEQMKIVEQLKTIDAKIELNRKINTTLEQTGRALFSHCFISNSNAEQWEDVRLKDITSYISRGISPKYDETGDSLVVNQRCIRDSRLHLANARRQSKVFSGEKLLKKGDVLINSTGVGTLGRIAQVEEALGNVTFDSHVTVVRPVIDAYFFGEMMRNLESVFESMGTGTTGQTELSRVAVGEVQVRLPPEDEIKSFSKEVNPMREQMQKNDQEIQTLTTLRDTLLPRLISGKLKVE